jgi:hypothetical protein
LPLWLFWSAPGHAFDLGDRDMADLALPDRPPGSEPPRGPHHLFGQRHADCFLAGPLLAQGCAASAGGPAPDPAAAESSPKSIARWRAAPRWPISACPPTATSPRGSPPSRSADHDRPRIVTVLRSGEHPAQTAGRPMAPGTLVTDGSSQWRAEIRGATIEHMIMKASATHRRTASSGHRAMPWLRAVRSWLHTWAPARIRARWTASAVPGEATASRAAPAVRQRQLRPIVVPASLDELHGPSSGLVTPPRRLWWSGEEGTAFDLANRVQAAELYEAIFEAARTYQDITDLLDARLLTELWPELGMRRATRQAWEAAHPVLAAAAVAGHAA